MNISTHRNDYASSFPNGSLWKIKKNGSVAIIMRTKDREILLARAFASVLAQKYQNWRLYLINDGGSLASVDKLVSAHARVFDGRIKVIHNPVSMGMEAASNCAASILKEDYVIVHDDDDSWHPDFLEQTVAFLEKEENISYGAVYTNCLVIREVIEGDRVKETSREEWGFFKQFIDGRDILRENSMPPICVLMRGDAVRKIGLFNSELPVLGDWDYFLRLFQLTDIGTLNQVLAYYHHRPKSSAQYGNTVVDGVDTHKQYQTLYRNALLRKFLDYDPTRLGLIHTLLSTHNLTHNEIMEKLRWIEHRIWEVDDVSSRKDLNAFNEIIHRLDELERRLNQIGVSEGHFKSITDKLNFISMVSSWQWKLLRPIHWIWRQLYPLRRAIVRIRSSR